jgi:hypothetical protein
MYVPARNQKWHAVCQLGSVNTNLSVASFPSTTQARGAAPDTATTEAACCTVESPSVEQHSNGSCMLRVRHTVVMCLRCLSLPLAMCCCLQAFQCSEQAVTLCKDGWFCPETEPSGVSKMRNPKEPSVEQPLIVVSESPWTAVCPGWLAVGCVAGDVSA